MFTLLTKIAAVLWSSKPPLELVYPIPAARPQYSSLLRTFQTSLVISSSPRCVGGIANIRAERGSPISIVTTFLRKLSSHTQVHESVTTRRDLSQSSVSSHWILQ